MSKIICTTILFFFFWQVSFAQSDILTNADQMPYFAGCSELKKDSDKKRNCSNNNLISYIVNTLQYPQEARDNGIEGKVIVSFVVNEKGLVEQQQVIRDIGSGCAKAALAVFDEMPRWIPAQHAGEKVKVKMTLPITFSLKAKNKAQKYTINWGTLRGQQISKVDLKEHLDKKIIVRDYLGNSQSISQLRVSFEKGSRYVFANSSGKITLEIQKIIKQAKKGGILLIEATVHNKGAFVEVEHQFQIQ